MYIIIFLYNFKDVKIFIFNKRYFLLIILACLLYYFNDILMISVYNKILILACIL